MRISGAALFLFLCLNGCSKPDDAHLIQAAIQHAYPSIYRDLSDLRKDYPGFTPRIRHWPDELTFLIGEGVYAVQMPEEEVLVHADGVATSTRTCGSQGADCTLVMPRNPELGVVGTVQLGPPDYPIAEGLEVSWKGAPGYTHVVGNCFAAFKASDEPLVLLLKLPGRDPIEISGGYGSRLIALTAESNGSYYGTTRISKSMFVESRDCSKQVRDKWPNVGGWSWKR